MKRYHASLALSVLLASCGGSSGGDIACELQYWDGEVGTCLPGDWHALDREELDDRGVPEEVIVAFQSDSPVSGQFATVTVTREALAQTMSSTDYSDASIVSVEGLPGYNQIDKQNLEIDGEDVSLHVFIAQPRDDQPESRFYQVSAVGVDAGYTFTASLPVSVDEELEEQALLILRNATFEAPAGE